MAFVVLGDDDKDSTAKLKARNKAEREANAKQAGALSLDNNAPIPRVTIC
jgi:hypothetical protein